MKTAVITGCNGGLGKCLLQRFASNGYDIIACSIAENEEFIRMCSGLETQYGITVHHIVYDSVDDDSLALALERIEAFEGDVSVLVNAAGINVIKLLLNTEKEDLQRTFMVNYFSTVLFTKKVAEKMIRQGEGAIVNISSIGSMGHQMGGRVTMRARRRLISLRSRSLKSLPLLGLELMR